MNALRRLSSGMRFVLANAILFGILATWIVVIPGTEYGWKQNPLLTNYAFGTPVTVTALPASCDVDTVIRRKKSEVTSRATCEGATWTSDGERVTGTLVANGFDVKRNSQGDLVFTGDARAHGTRAFGYRGPGEIEMTLLGIIALGVSGLALLGSAVVFIVGRTRRGDKAEAARPLTEPPEGIGRPIRWHRAKVGYTWLLVAEATGIGTAFGVVVTIFDAGFVAVVGGGGAAAGAAATIFFGRRFVSGLSSSGKALAFVGEHGLWLDRHGKQHLVLWANARFCGVPEAWSPSADDRAFTLYTLDGAWFRFDADQWTDFANLRHEAYRRIREQSWPRLIAACEAGKPVTFGKFTVSKKGVSRGGAFAPWSLIENVQRGPEWVRISSTKFMKEDADHAKTPDVELLLAITQKLHAQSRTTT